MCQQTTSEQAEIPAEQTEQTTEQPVNDTGTQKLAMYIPVKERPPKMIFWTG